MQFDYRALTKSGEVVSDTQKAKSRFECLEILRSEGLTVLDIKESSGKESSSETPHKFLPKPGWGRITPKTIALFTRQLSDLMEAGIPLAESLSSLRKNTTSSKFQEVVSDVEKRVRQGENFSTALEHHGEVFSSVYIGLVKAGEVSGQLPEVIAGLAEYQDREMRLAGELRSALFYPAFTLGFAFLMCYVMVTWLLPGFSSVWQESGLDLSRYPITEAMLELSKFTHSWVDELLLALAICAIVYAYRALVSSTQGRFQRDNFFLNLPYFGNFVQMGTLARSMNTLGTLFSAGIPAVKSLDITAETAGNEVLRQGFQQVSSKVQEGCSLYQAFEDTKLFPPIFLQMLGIAETSQRMDQMLPRMAAYYDRQLQDSLKALTSVLEPLTMIGVGGVVFVFILGVFLPIMGLVQAVGSG